jgi:hypothetical protein
MAPLTLFALFEAFSPQSFKSFLTAAIIEDDNAPRQHQERSQLAFIIRQEIYPSPGEGSELSER